MTPIDRFERHLPDRLAELANAHVPDYFDDLLTQTGRSRQRPAWTFIERWIPMALLTQSGARVRPIRQTWQLARGPGRHPGLVAGSPSRVPGCCCRPAGSGLQRSRHRPDPRTRRRRGTPTTIDGLSKPSFMDIGPDGNLYVVNAGNSEILVLDPTGTIVRRWGSSGAGEGQFDFLRDAADPVLGHRWCGRRTRWLGLCRGHHQRSGPAVHSRRCTSFGSGAALGRPTASSWSPFDVAVGPDGSVLGRR